MAGQTHAAHHIDLKETLPFRVFNLQKRLGIEDAEIVDENVDSGTWLVKSCTPRGSQIGRNAADHGSRRLRFELADRIRDSAFVAAIDYHVGAGRREALAIA